MDRGIFGHSFTPEEKQKVLRSPEATALLNLLKSDGGAGLAEATRAVNHGDFAKAAAVLKPMLNSPESEQLLRTLGEKLGRP